MKPQESSLQIVPDFALRPDMREPEKYAVLSNGQKVKWTKLWEGLWVDRRWVQLPQGVKMDLDAYLNRVGLR